MTNISISLAFRNDQTNNQREKKSTKGSWERHCQFLIYFEWSFSLIFIKELRDNMEYDDKNDELLTTIICNLDVFYFQLDH
jgi:hypothetical protein